MEYISFEKQELLAFLDNTVELNATEVNTTLHPYMSKLRDVYIPAAKKLAKRLQTPEAMDLLIELSELTVALSTITVTPYISITSALAILYTIKDNPIIEEYIPEFKGIVLNIQKLEKVLTNFNKMYKAVRHPGMNTSGRSKEKFNIKDRENYMAANEE